MIKIFVLAVLLPGGFTILPMASDAACRAAMAGINTAIAISAECYQVEMIAPDGSQYAPETAPLPKPKPGDAA